MRVVSDRCGTTEQYQSVRSATERLQRVIDALRHRVEQLELGDTRWVRALEFLAHLSESDGRILTITSITRRSRGLARPLNISNQVHSDFGLPDARRRALRARAGMMRASDT